MNDKLTQLASIAEIAGAIAVVVSLLYVGIQVSDNVAAVRSASANDANAAVQEWYLQVGSDRQTSELFYRGMISEEPLPNDEEFQFLMMMHAFFLGLQNTYLLAQQGTIDMELRRSLTSALHGVSQLPGMHRYWRQRRNYLHADFVAWTEEALAAGTEVTVDIYKLPADDAEQE